MFSSPAELVMDILLQRQVYDYTENNGPHILAVFGFLAAIAFLVILLRIYVRAVMTNTMGVDDYIMVAAGVCCIAVLVCSIQEVKLGIGRHSLDPVLLGNFTEIMLYSWISSLFLVAGISSVKISVGFFLLRVVNGTKYKRLIIGMIVFLIVFTLACLGTLVFQCLPVKAAWDFPLRSTAKCYDSETFTAIGLFNGAINIITDVAFAVLPIPVIWGLNVNLRTKISLILILSLGFFACAAALVKEILLSTFFSTPDFSFKNTYAIWNFVEFTVGIVAACLPALRPLFAFILEKTASTFTTGQRNLSTRHKYYMQSNDINLSSIPATQSADRYGVTVTSNGRAFDEGHSRPMGKLEQSLDSNSEENILPIQDVENGRMKNNRIVKTTEVHVS